MKIGSINNVNKKSNTARKVALGVAASAALVAGIAVAGYKTGKFQDIVWDKFVKAPNGGSLSSKGFGMPPIKSCFKMPFGLTALKKTKTGEVISENISGYTKHPAEILIALDSLGKSICNIANKITSKF